MKEPERERDGLIWRPFWGPVPSKRKLQILGLFVVLMLAITNLANWYTYNYKGDSVHDIMFDLLPDWSHVDPPIPNFITILQGACVLLSVKPLLRTICQIAFLITLLDIVRALTVVSTTMPLAKADQYSDRCLHHPRSFTETFFIVLNEGTCGDYMFSGHITTSVVLLLFTLTRSSSAMYKGLSVLCTCAMIFFLIAMRWHYTDDVLVGIIVSALSFQLYDAYSRMETWRDYWFYFAAPTKKKEQQEVQEQQEEQAYSNSLRF